MQGLGIKVDTSRIAAGSVPAVGKSVSVRGVSSLWFDGSAVRPLVIPRGAGDLNGPFN
jgi:hypothetical protein